MYHIYVSYATAVTHLEITRTGGTKHVSAINFNNLLDKIWTLELGGCLGGTLGPRWATKSVHFDHSTAGAHRRPNWRQTLDCDLFPWPPSPFPGPLMKAWAESPPPQPETKSISGIWRRGFHMGTYP